jgi:hypothetical protein
VRLHVQLLTRPIKAKIDKPTDKAMLEKFLSGFSDSDVFLTLPSFCRFSVSCTDDVDENFVES